MDRVWRRVPVSSLRCAGHGATTAAADGLAWRGRWRRRLDTSRKNAEPALFFFSPMCRPTGLDIIRSTLEPSGTAVVLV
jgi:hypothetical protein